MGDEGKGNNNCTLLFLFFWEFAQLCTFFRKSWKKKKRKWPSHTSILVMKSLARVSILPHPHNQFFSWMFSVCRWAAYEDVGSFGSMLQSFASMTDVIMLSNWPMFMDAAGDVGNTTLANLLFFSFKVHLSLEKQSLLYRTARCVWRYNVNIVIKWYWNIFEVPVMYP